TAGWGPALDIRMSTDGPRRRLRGVAAWATLFRSCERFRAVSLSLASRGARGAASHANMREGREMSAQPFALPPLRLAEDALAPVIPKQTIEFHYGKHHAAYVNNLNGLVSGTDMADMSLAEIVRKVMDAPDKQAIFNNAG